MIDNNILFVHRFLTSLVFTDTIETIVLILFLRFYLESQAPRIRDMIFAGLYASFSTISYVWFVFPYLLVWSSSSIEVTFAELFAFVVEAVFYRWLLKLDWRVAFLVSFICNGISFVLGPILRANGLWITW